MNAIEDLIPKKHLLKKVEDLYFKEFGRPIIDPVVLVKIILIQPPYVISSIRQIIRNLKVNIAYR